MNGGILGALAIGFVLFAGFWLILDALLALADLILRRKVR